MGEIGDLYKIRVSREDLHTWNAWHLEEVKLQDLDTSEVFIIHCDRWLSREKDDFDLTREFPITHKNKTPPEGESTRERYQRCSLSTHPSLYLPNTESACFPYLSLTNTDSTSPNDLFQTRILSILPYQGVKGILVPQPIYSK